MEVEATLRWSRLRVRDFRRDATKCAVDVNCGSMTCGFDVSWSQITKVGLIGGDHIDLFDQRPRHVTLHRPWNTYRNLIAQRQVKSLTQSLPHKVGARSMIWAEAIGTNLRAVYLLDLRDF